MSGCHSYIRTYIHIQIHVQQICKVSVLLYKYVYASLSIGRVYKHPLFIHALATMYVISLHIVLIHSSVRAAALVKARSYVCV